MLKLIVMSDIHMLPPAQIEYGIDTAAQFRKAVTQANQYYGDADLCVYAGDITDKAEVEAYQQFDQIRQGHKIPSCVLLGNHDDRPTYIDYARTDGSQAPMVDENGFIQGYADLKGHRIVMLDSSEPGHDDGILCEKRLIWLQQRLGEATVLDLTVIIIMHHHIRQIQLDHLDEIKLKQCDTFEQILRTSGANIAQIISGHCHITSAGSWLGFPIATLSGNQLRNDINLKNGQEKVQFFEAFGQFAVLHADDDGVTVHYHNYMIAK